MPSFLGRHITVCSHLLRCGGDPPACLCGVLSPRGPPFCFVWWVGSVRSCPGLCSPCRPLSLVLCFAFSRAWPLFGCDCVVSVFLPARLWASVRGRRAPFCGWLGLLFSVVCLAVVGSPPLPIDASLPPAVGPLWRPGPVFSLVPPSGYLVAFVTAWLPCRPAGGVVVLCRPHFILSHGSKGLWPCVGFVVPLHHDACVVRVLSTTTLRYSSMMIQVPHWTPLSYTFAILKQ